MILRYKLPDGNFSEPIWTTGLEVVSEKYPDNVVEVYQRKSAGVIYIKES